VIDLHSHVLPGLDDGAADVEESLAMARAAVAAGISTLAATPHVRDDYPTTADEMEAALGLVREAVAAAGLDLALLPGAEVALDWLDRIPYEELQRFGLGGNPKCLLLEFPYRGWPLDVGDRVFDLRLQGVVPVLAHPERNDAVQDQPTKLVPLARAGAVIQLTAASLDGRNGRRARATSRALLELECAHLIASEPHAPAVRAIGLEEAVATLGSPSLGRWLTEEVPLALIGAEPLPARPSAARRRRLFSRPRSG
jgi:protein-tyrosine phosphatase